MGFGISVVRRKLHVCHKSYQAFRLRRAVYGSSGVACYPLPSLSPCDTQHPAYDPPHNNPFYISHDTHFFQHCLPYLPVLYFKYEYWCVRFGGFGVLGLIIHFLTASSTPSPDTSWEHSRHNSLKQNFMLENRQSGQTDADLTT